MLEYIIFETRRIQMKAVITVIGKDKKVIIATVAGACARYGANILDISQTVMREYF